MIKKIIEYKNAVLCKLQNRRVSVRRTKDEHIFIEFSRLSDSGNPATYSEFKRGVLYSGIKISQEAAIALQIALTTYLESHMVEEYVKTNITGEELEIKQL